MRRSVCSGGSMGNVSQEGNVGNVNNRGAGDLNEVSTGHGFEVGDMVWGKVKSHPWWPGHVYSEELATPSVRRSKRDGLLLVAFFGDSSYGWFDPSELIPFDSNFAEKSVQTNSRTFVKALDDAIDEVRRRSSLGLSCMCRNKQNFKQTDAQGFLAVDVVGYEPGAVYSMNTIRKARENFHPRLALDFVKELGLEPTNEHDDIDFIKNKALVMSYRRAVYKEFDETYDQAFGGDLVRPLPGSLKFSNSGKKPSKAPLSGRQVFGDTLGKLKIQRRDHHHDQPKQSTPPHPADIEDPIIATLKVSTTNINNLDFEINTPISSLIHNSSNVQNSVTQNDIPSPGPRPHNISGPQKKVNVSKRPPGTTLLVEKKIKKRKKESLMDKIEDANSVHQMELPRVLADLRLFALDPFHTNNRKVRQVFLNFRSLVFQKSLTQNRPNSKPQQKGIKRDRHEAKKKNEIKKLDEKGGRQVSVVKRVVKPTTLKMEFPSGGSLPSISELKAKLGHYGTMDHDGTRIYWKTFTCLVVYKYKEDAEVALKAVTGSNLFGNINVKYTLNQVSDSTPPAKVSDHQPLVEDRAVAGSPDLPAKPCLKKSGGVEGVSSGGKKIPRVNFYSQKGVLSHPNSTGVSSSTAKSTPPPPPPVPPPPPLSLVSPPPRSMLVAPPSLPLPRSTRPAAMTPPPNIDIAQQMVTLLTRCNDVVANVTGILGYVPYHPL